MADGRFLHKKRIFRLYPRSFNKYLTMLRRFLFLALSALLTACGHSGQTSDGGEMSEEFTYLSVTRALVPPVIDGNPDEEVWKALEWHPIDQRWLGPEYSADDFSGRYKLAWSPAHLYILVEIQDDTLVDIYPDGLFRYWDDDCLEVFIDEDASGGDHQYNHNAFAYHIALDGRVVDIGTDSLFRYYDEHCQNSRRCEGNICYWELALRVYPDTYRDDSEENRPVILEAGKVMGFALAYCDNDHSEERENFIGSVPVEGEDKNRGWIDAGIFGKIRLE